MTVSPTATSAGRQRPKSRAPHAAAGGSVFLPTTRSPHQGAIGFPHDAAESSWATRTSAMPSWVPADMVVPHVSQPLSMPVPGHRPVRQPPHRSACAVGGERADTP